MNSLILARVEIHQIIGISVLVITVLGWLVNIVQGNTDNGPRQPKPKPKANSGRSEIEDLLQELSGSKGKQKPAQQREPARPAKPPVERSRAKSKPGPQKLTGLPAQATSRPSTRAAVSNLPSSNLGGELRSHQLGNQIDAAVRKEITDAVQIDLGTGIAAASATPVERPVHPLVKVLRDPNGVRQAILLNEVLQRPKALRR